jgi:hypothetical protein
MRKNIFYLGSIFLLLFFSCKKIETVSSTNSSSLNSTSSFPGCHSYPLIDSMPAFDIDADSVEIPTILGNQRTNPYTIANMHQAYTNLGLPGYSVNVTNLYVRFLPNSAEQLGILDSLLDSQDLEMFDAPVDYDVLQEGDYYQDPSIPDSSVTWQYAVVPPSFQFPAGITYQVLSQIHIPGDDYTAVETEAERLASIQDSIICSGGISRSNRILIPDCGPDYHWDYNLLQCVCNCCPDGYYWDGTQCLPIPPPPPPLPPAPDAQVPAGNITVSDVNFGTTPGVRTARVVAKRWFKIQRVYTDINGNFQFTKRFKHKVKINVKFRNNDAVIKSVRGIRFWQMLYPVTKTIGVFSGNKNNIHYNFQKYNTAVSFKGNLYWAAATVHNSVQEYRNYCILENFGLPPSHLKIFLSKLVSHGGGMTPMWNKRWFSGFPQEVGLTFFASVFSPVAGGFVAFAAVLKHEVDMVISYRAESSDYSTFFSDDLKTTAYHELTHSAHYAALGNGWYSNFVGAEINEVILTLFSSNSPYGSGSNTFDSPIIALGESWAYHMGQYLAGMQYGMASSPAGEQSTSYSNGDIIGLNSHQIALENFDPNFTTAPFHWIPKGLFYDMMDGRNDFLAIPLFVNIDDQVSVYTNQKFFDAFNSNITSLGAYQQNLLQQNVGNQSAQITNLFQQYGY